MLRFARRDLLRNPRRTIASLAGVVLGVGLFSGVLFFIDGSGRVDDETGDRAGRRSTCSASSPLHSGRVYASSSGSPPGPLRQGRADEDGTDVRNGGADRRPTRCWSATSFRPTFSYVPGPARRDGQPIPEAGGQSPFAHWPGPDRPQHGDGGPGQTVLFKYPLQATAPEPEPAAHPSCGATIASPREGRPRAGQQAPLGTARPSCATESRHPGRGGRRPALIRKSSGPFFGPRAARTSAGRSRSSASTAPTPGSTRPFRSVAGGFRQGTARCSAPRRPDFSACKAGDTGRHSSLPGATPPARIQVSGIADLSRARALFNSR